MLIKAAKSFVIVILGMVIWLASTDVEASQVLNIGLTRFETIPLDNAVRIEWETETELGTAGYKLKRGQNGTFSFLQDPDGNGDLFVPSEGGPSQGSGYSFVDDTAVNGESYTYQLIEVTTDGSETIQANQTVTAGVEPTNTPIVLGGGGGNNQNNTPTPEPTTTATITPISNGTPLPSPTLLQSAVSTQTPLPSPTNITTLEENEVGSPAADVEDFPTPVSQLSGTTANSEQATDAGIAIAQAQEESSVEQLPAYPAAGTGGSEQENLQTGSAATSSQDEISEQNNASTDNNSQPTVIGNIRSIENRPIVENEGESQESNASQSATAGRIYLWVAFIAALVIFVAAVIGAILLYTRRQNRE
jgi:hypothetical protein